jgi:hypothetical protein
VIRKKTSVFLLCAAALGLIIISCLTNSKKEEKVLGPKITITINTGEGRKPISPYIYGVNDFVLDGEVTAFSVRQGGNRYTAYNWENNLSNAGNDWHHFNDDYLSKSKEPADCALTLADMADKQKVPYKVTTLQMAGYVSADGNREVIKNETAPSGRFKEIRFTKNAPFETPPNLNDNYVYMDEYVNYLVKKLGQGGMNYNLDNEPALWPETHPRVHPKKTGAAELVEKSAALAAAVKAVDPKAEILGPALYGIGAYSNLHAPDDWKQIMQSKDYDWYISYYLDEMKQKEELAGRRLLDVLDVHFYSEARGKCRITECNDESHVSCINARLQAARTLWQTSYYEKSWIGDYMKRHLPVINKLNQSIEKYYPGTKLGFTEYNLGGGGQISGAVAQADILGVFGKTGVYLAAIWPLQTNCSYQLSAINLYTNYDGKGSSFGNTHVSAECSNIENAYTYASIKDGDSSVLTIVAANKSFTAHHDMEINIESPVAYSSAVPYMITKGSHKIIEGAALPVAGNTIVIQLPPLTVIQLVVR